MNTKRCPTCMFQLPVTEFWNNKSNKDGLTSQCKKCLKSSRANYKNMPKIYSSTDTKQCSTCKKFLLVSEFHKNSYRRGGIHYECKNCRNINYLKYKSNNSNISYDIYDELYIEQNGKCAICKKDIDLKNLSLDHCHKTGKTRGLLCDSCNVGLGMFKDNIEFLENAIEYLIKN